MKFVLTLILILLAVTSFAYNWYAESFTEFDPSVINQALGGNGIGVTNVWHNNALLSYANPAIAAFHEGISYGISQNAWWKGNDWYDYLHSAGLLNIGYKGIGLILPVPSFNSETGVYMRYKWIYSGEIKSTYYGAEDEYERANMYGFAINLMELIRLQNPENTLFKHYDLAVGFTKRNFKSKLYLSDSDFHYYWSGNYIDYKGNSVDFGTLAKVNYTVGSRLKLEGVYGASFYNCLEDSMSYYGHQEMVYRQRNHGLALAMSVLPIEKLSSSGFWHSLLGENLLSLRLMGSYLNNYNKQDDCYSFGTEIGALDIVFLRYGRYDDRGMNIKGDSYGIGINLHYKDLVTYTFNYANFPSCCGRQGSTDHNLAFNLIKLIPLF